jgi:hypothetical protein
MNQVHVRKTIGSHLTLSTPASTEEVRKWLAQLPKVNLKVSSELILDALHQLQKHPAETVAHLNQLALLAESVSYFANMLKQRYMHDSSLHPKERRAFIQLAERQHQRLADSYLHLVQHSGHSFSSMQQAQALQQALKHYQKILLSQFQLYLPADARIVGKCYALYQLASERYLQSLSWHDTKSEAHTIEHEFKVTLLLLTMGPYQLTTYDIERIYQSLNQLATVTKLHNHIQGDDLFAIDLSSKRSPIYTDLIDEAEYAKYLGFNTSKIESRLQSDSKTTKNLSDHMKRSWGSCPTREFMRMPANGKVNACIGLASIHYFLNDHENVVPFPQQTRRQQRREWY